jgi:hypothetical protein
MRLAEQGVIENLFEYKRVGYDSRPMTFLPDGYIGQGAARREAFWKIEEHRGDALLLILGSPGITCVLRESADAVWRGRWLCHEKMPIELRPLARLTASTEATGRNPAKSLFILSLPRSLSTVVYRMSRRALQLGEPAWTSDGEVLNPDRFDFWNRARKGSGIKFIVEEREPGAFRGLLEFLGHAVARRGWCYKDVVQPFVVAEWVKRYAFPTIRIRRNVADVAYSMLRRQWHYPARLGSRGDSLEWAMVKGLVRAERALDSAPAQPVDFDEMIADEKSLGNALAAIYGKRSRAENVKYIDREFELMRAEVLRRRRTREHRRLTKLVIEAEEFWERGGDIAQWRTRMLDASLKP